MNAWTWQDYTMAIGIGLFFWIWAWIQVAIWDERSDAWEYTRAHLGTNYSRHSLEEKEQEGWEQCSDVDPRYGSIWMRRRAC